MSSEDHPSVAFVTTLDTAILHDDFDLPFHIEAFADAGVHLVHAAWEDPDVDWDRFDLVIVRSTWNYVDRLEEFRGWMQARSDLRTLHNPPAVIGWNLDKRYLAELAGHGVAVIPTAYASDGAQLMRVLGAASARQVVVKPSISAGSRLTGRFLAGSAVAQELGERILAAGFTVMVQPFAESVDAAGEIGAVLLDGAISHSFRKGPLLGEEGTLRGGEYSEEITAAELSRAERALVLAANDAVEAIAREHHGLGPEEHLLYARYDLVTLDDGSPALLEAELFEPSLFLMVDPTSPRRFIDAVRRRI